MEGRLLYGACLLFFKEKMIMQFKCERCDEVFVNEDSLAVFSDVPVLTGGNGRDGTTYYGECPLCGGTVYPMEEEIPVQIMQAAG